jgi:hypothetical protein
MTSNTGIARGAVGVGALAAGLVASAMVDTLRAAAAANGERAADTYARSVVREWQMTLAAEKARNRKLALDLREARSQVAELSDENAYLRERVAQLKARLGDL